MTPKPNQDKNKTTCGTSFTWEKLERCTPPLSQSLMQPGCQFWCQVAPPPPQLQYLHWPLQLAPNISSSVCNGWAPQKEGGAHRVTLGPGTQEVLVLPCTLMPWVAHKDKISSDPLLRTPVIEACLDLGAVRLPRLDSSVAK